MSRKLLLALALVVTVGLALGGNAHASSSTFTVNSTADPGDGTCDATECTLREAIGQADATPGTDTIAFNIPGTGPHTIQPASALPTITDPVIIDGYTQPGASPNTNGPGLGKNAILMIELDGSQAGPALALYVTAGSSTVRGLVVNRFTRGIIVHSSGNTIEGNFIGTDVTGTESLPNTWDGVWVAGTNNTVGGTAPAAGNVIAGHGLGGLRVAPWLGGDPLPSGNQLLGNFIGTDVTGTTALGNWGGVELQGINNTVGGTTPAARNVISANAYGIHLDQGVVTGNQVLGNFIGTDVTGTADLGNGYEGVWLDWASGNAIGGTAAGAGNLISGNGRSGVLSYGWNNTIEGNLIGTDVTGTADLGNGGDGVAITDGASNNRIGGTAAGAANTIAYNAGAGVAVSGASSLGNAIRGNSIHSNGGKGIETMNGGNADLPPPVIDSVGSASGHTNPKCYPCTVDVFSDNEDEGRIYHGSAATNDDATGTWAYAGTVTGPTITATVTDASGNTSEFPSPPVGGIAELAVLAGPSPEEADAPAEGSGWSAAAYGALAGGLAAAAFAVTAGAWYARRRWLG